MNTLMGLGGPPIPGLNQTAEDIFRRRPLGCPLTLIIVSGAIILLALSTGHLGRSPLAARALGMAILMLAAGVVILIFGITTVLRRRLNPVVLCCPRCGTESRTARKPFAVQRWYDVPYANITCSVCGKDFTVDKHARLE